MSILFLNGTSSAGKTSVARLLMERLEPPHLYLGIDDAFAMLPAKLHAHPDGFFFDTDERGEVRLNHGPLGFAALRAHVRSAASMAADGVDLILDEVVLEELREDWKGALAGLAVFAVGLHCALPELERRELARGDRVVGQARGQFDVVHQGMNYALEVDVTALTPDQVADRIAIDYLDWRNRSALRNLPPSG